MTLCGIIATVLVCAAAIYCIVSMLHLRRASFAAARTNAKISLLTSAVAAPLALGAAIFGAVFEHGAESKATTLARGISESMNVGVFHFPAMFASSVVWLMARQRLSKPTRKP